MVLRDASASKKLEGNATLCVYCVHTSVPKATDIYTGVARLDGLFSSQASNVGISKPAFEASGQQWW